MALQIALMREWVVSVGDIRSAFLQGIEAPRKLYFRQPKRGIPGLEPGQLVEILKGVFGLSTSPKLWWMKLSGDLKGIKIDYNEDTIYVTQNTIDPCVFVLQGVKSQRVHGLLLTHVDDLMLLAEPKLSQQFQQVLSKRFPVDEWEQGEFEYVGCEYRCEKDTIYVTQKNYVNNRVGKVTIGKGQSPDDKATPEQREENRTSIGCMSWLAKQTRPDLQFQVCQAQRRQQDPLVKGLKETNRLVSDALAFKDDGLVLRKMDEKDVCFIAFHDAAWGNVSPDDAEPSDEQWLGEHQVASQLASLVVLAEQSCLTNKGGHFSIVEWKSKASQRVCRSTFAGETMAASDALEATLYLRSLYLSFTTGVHVTENDAGSMMPLHLVTDCRSLFDRVHREGVPRTPAEKRLAIDLAGLRQALMAEARHQWSRRFPSATSPTPEMPVKPPLHWVPTHEQLADVLTKRLKAQDWWSTVRAGILALPLKHHAECTEKT